MRATSPETALDNINELQPLVFREEDLKNAGPAASPEFCHGRPDNPLAEMKVRLLSTRTDEKILLTGHLGSGKSTELNRLAADPDIQKNFFVVKYGVREIVLREKMRKSIGRNMTELVEVINLTIDQIRANLPGSRQLLVIVDDLEKIPDVARADQLFNQAGPYMTLPRCKVIYTLPIALYYSVSIKQIMNTFNEVYFLSNVNLIVRNGKDIPKSYDLMAGFLEKRMELALIEKDALHEAIFYSGGGVRELMRIIKNSLVKALANGRKAMPRDLISAVVIKLRDEFSRGLLGRHYKVLQAVQENRESEIDDKQALMELYHARVLLEYGNGGRWNAINPIVLPLVSKIQKNV